jgi:nucleotide-binding universal stress UspA family protein
MSAIPLAPFRTILVPLDGSPFAERALAPAAAVAGRDGGTLYLARVHEPALAFVGPMVGTEPVVDVQLDAETRVAQAEGLQQLAAEVKERTGLAVHWALLDDGAVADTLRDHALDIGADLIVMTTHGRTGLGRTVFGSVAASVVRETNLPVLVVRPEDGGAAPPAFLRKIAVLLDGSSLAEAVLEPAMRLAVPAKATLELVRVVSPTAIPMAPGPVPMAMVDPEVFEIEVREAEAYLERIAARLRAQGVAVTTRCERAGTPGPALVDVIRRERVDAVAMATHGRSGLSRALLGSVADHVVKEAGVPVLLYRPKE